MTAGELDALIIAQPRALSGAENVALDRWVRGGGRALIFADPMLTAHSDFSLGDPRRPQDVVLLSPILARWGLALSFDDTQQPARRNVPLNGTTIPVDLAGQWGIANDGTDAACELSAQGVLAVCEIGAGRVVILADAAILSGETPLPGARNGVRHLMRTAFR